MKRLIVTFILCLTAACDSSGECAECQAEKCQDLVDFCEADDECACMSACLAKSGVPGVDDCLQECGLDARPAAFAPLEACVAVACPDSDECSTPAGYQEPDAVAGAGEQPPMPTAIGSGMDDDCAFDPREAFDADGGSVLQLEGAQGSVCVRIERRNEGRGELANTQWTLIDLRVGPLGEVAHIDAQENLCWYSSHHNFKDWAHGWSGGMHYDVELLEDGHGGEREYRLHVFEQGPIGGGLCAPITDGETPIGGPIELVPYQP